MKARGNQPTGLHQFGTLIVWALQTVPERYTPRCLAGGLREGPKWVEIGHQAIGRIALTLLASLDQSNPGQLALPNVRRTSLGPRATPRLMRGRKEPRGMRLPRGS